MKNLFWLSGLFIVLFFRCAGNKAFDTQKISSPVISQKTDTLADKIIKTEIRIIPGKHFVWKKDGAGKFYPVLAPADGFAVSITKRIDLVHPLPDSGMDYVVLFNLPKTIDKKEFIDRELKKIDTFSGFMAFHPDSGYHPAKKGKIKIEPDLKHHRILITIDLAEKHTETINGRYEVKI